MITKILWDDDNGEHDVAFEPIIYPVNRDSTYVIEYHTKPSDEKDS